LRGFLFQDYALFPLAVVTAQSAEELGLAAGQGIAAVIKTTAVHLAAIS
jgi:molybdopterin-binding protein